ncbi:ABC-type transport system, involved in lipoprotein release, permease component [Lachnospiraceae bacterium]|nr:ABC-type transport system, involved in lipoprotein release, permease component [Lachnospiraceae bacterium]
MKILRLSFANIKKHKKESVLFMILITLGIVLLSASVSSVLGIKQITPKMVEESGCFKNFIYIKQDNYSDIYLEFLKDNEQVESFDHTSFVSDSIKVRSKDEGDLLADITFVTESGERRMESFKTDADFNSAEHPIVLASVNKDKYELSVGDDFTILWDNKELTFTVIGFYETGIWGYGTKAVISEDDFEYLENSMSERYEMIGINTNDGVDNSSLLKDFKAFAKEASINDLSGAMYASTYEETVSNNDINMALLSIIIMIMSAVIVIAIMIIIRFRIVSDIQEQIVSIGVLEAMGYTSKEIAASYIAEYVLIALVSAVIGLVPANLMAEGLLKNAASSVYYGGPVTVPAVPIIICILAILIFVGLIALSRAIAVRKYPPVMAFRKGIETHSFKKTILPLDKTKKSVHIRLAVKELLQNAKNHVGLTVCIMACTVLTLLGFILGTFFASPDRILGSVCGHELCDIRIEAVGDIEPDAFATELEGMSEVRQVLTPATGIGVKINDDDLAFGLEVYDDYSKTSTIILTEGRLPEHENEVSLTIQSQKRIGATVGDTLTLEYGKVKKDYVLTGIVNSAVNPTAAYLTTDGFKRMNPEYMPSTFDIYLNEGVDKNEVADLLRERYGNEIADYKDAETTDGNLEERIRSVANKKMAEAMTENGVSYMEYSIQVGDETITGSTSLMKIKTLTFEREENEEIANMLLVSFAGIAVALMLVSAIVVILILSILMASTIRKQYRELGIMKGLGYTSRELKFQLAFRIIPVAVLAVVLGTVLSILLMQVVNVYVCKIIVSAVSIIMVDIAILVYCFICAYISARRIKKISVYELISE